MKKEMLVSHLAELPALYHKQREFSNSWADKWLTEAELSVYERLKKIEYDIDERVDEAKNAVVRPSPEYPKEYQVILTQLAELKPYIKQVEAIMSALRNLDSTIYPQARTVANLFYDKSANEVEYSELSKTKERREYINSKVTKIRLASYEVYTSEVKKIEEETRKQLETQYADSLKRKGELEQLIHSRRLEKLQPIKTQIRELLDTAIQQDDKSGEKV